MIWGRTYQQKKEDKKEDKKKESELSRQGFWINTPFPWKLSNGRWVWLEKIYARVEKDDWGYPRNKWYYYEKKPE